MKLWMKILLWLFVALVPGGSLALPLLIGDALWKRRSATASLASTGSVSAT